MEKRKRSRDDFITADQKLIDGIQNNRATLPPKILVRSRAMSPDDILAMLEGRIAAAKAAQRATAAHTAAVKADADMHDQTRADVTALRGILVRSFAESPDRLGEFGLPPPAHPRVPAATKAEAARKAAATRRAHHPPAPPTTKSTTSS